MRTLQWAIVAAAAAGVMSAWGDPMRTLVVQEGKIPQTRQPEMGLRTVYQEITETDSPQSDDNYGALEPYLRLALSHDFSLNLAVPLARTELGGSDSYGLGDIVVGADLMGWQGALGYPYVMPYARLALPTGDEEEGLGAGETRLKFGLSLGTTVEDDWDFVADIGFVARSETDNSLQLGGALVYTFRPEFSLLAEVMYESWSGDALDDRTLALGGLIYRPAERWLIGLYGGTEFGDVDDNLIVGAKLSWTMR